MTALIGAILGGGLILTLLQMVNGAAFPPMALPTPPNTLPWLIAANIIVAGMLTWIARRSTWTGWRLAAGLIVVSYGVGYLNTWIEGYVFHLFKRPGELQDLVLRTLIPAIVFPPIVVWLAGRRHAGATPDRGRPARSVASWIARFAACSVAYLVLYFTAGIIIFPYVESFYTELPPGSTVILLQLLVRGPIFVAIGWLIVTMTVGSRREHALMVGAAMSLLAGAAPLLVPNPYFPDAVRWVHFCEVVSSNFVFGAIVGWLMNGSAEHARSRVMRHAAA